MSSVVIKNRNILNQKVSSIDNNKVFLPFNVSKEQTKKLGEMLSKIKVTFLSEQDKLNIANLSYGEINVKPTDRNLSNCRFTLSKTYIVTMKRSFITKVGTFYKRLVEKKEPERPVFSIGNETNLQAALAEATTEIDLSTLNTTVNNIENPLEQPSQVLANNPSGETIIGTPVNLNNNGQQENNIPVPAINVPEINNTEQVTQPQVQENSVNVVPQPVMSTSPEMMPQTPETMEKPKTLIKSKKGNILSIAVVAIWLVLIFVGTLKLVTSILT